MQLFCSTWHNDELRPPLPSARKLRRSAAFDIWSIQSPISQFLREVGALLRDGSVVSACILSEEPPAETEWLYFEWRGKLVVDAALVDQVLHDAGRWNRTQVDEQRHLAIFAPADSPSDGFSARALEYRRLLDGGKAGEVVLERDWIESEDALRTLFGHYADPKIGGAVALLTLSGAAGADVREFTLRTPVALELDVDSSPESLTSEPTRAALAIRCVGFSILQELGQQDGLSTSRERWAELYKEASSSSPVDYFVALELEASLDPAIVIRRGTVFEQRALIGVQTLAAATEQQTVVALGEVKPLIIPAYCLNARLQAPHGDPVRPTPFVYRRATGTQGDVWRSRGER